MDIKFSVESIEMQPTSLCNLNCNYCYLSGRDKNQIMTPIIAGKVAQGVAEIGNVIELIWHGGEPLICGVNHFSQLVSPFEQLRKQGLINHGIQTNATLINERWCEFFISHKFRVGISLDGPAWANTQRVGWNNNPVFDKIMRGVNHLREADIPFSVICVVGKESFGKARELYRFFSDLGCVSLGVNTEESLGVHVASSCNDEATVVNFWKELFLAWRENPVIKMRDFDRILSSLAVLGDETQDELPRLYDIFPSVAWDGNIVLLAPEFLNTNTPKYDNFVVGNILTENLQEIVHKGKSVSYVKDFSHGVSRCREECEYFPLCYGGQAGNKFSEHGTTDATETAFCLNSEKRLINAVLQQMEQSKT